MKPVWIDQDTVLAVHDEQLAEHGGRSGVRDLGLVESALARPQHLFSYETPDLIRLAAAYGYAFSRNHAFVDGNKRVAAVITETFLYLNGLEVTADDSAIVRVYAALADSSGDCGEDRFEAWLRENTQPL